MLQGCRLNLYFDDVTEGAGAATPTEIDALFDFAQTWLSVARSDPASASIVIHCGAGISRSAAAALFLLTLYFSNYLAAATHLFRTHPQVSSNALVCRLICENWVRVSDQISSRRLPEAREALDKTPKTALRLAALYFAGRVLTSRARRQPERTARSRPRSPIQLSDRPSTRNFLAELAASLPPIVGATALVPSDLAMTYSAIVR